MIMKNGVIYITGVLLICGLLFFTGCVNYLRPELGAVARVDARVSLVDDQISSAVLKTKDLELEYALSSDGETFEISGKLIFDRSITASYPMLRRFVMRVNFLDATGAVIESASIAPNINTHSEVPDVIQLRSSGIKPPGATAIAFNYFGTFSSATLRSGGDESWEAFYMPFD